MKKKILLCLLILTGLFVFTGCDNAITDIIKNPDEVVIGGTTIKFDHDCKYYDLEYKTPFETKPNYDYINHIIKYEDKSLYDGDYLFRIDVNFREGKNADYIIKLAKAPSMTKKVYNGNEWTVFETHTTKHETRVFFIEVKDDLYYIQVHKDNKALFDIDDVADVFMNHVTINK